jgi:hypothetical protein
MTFQEVTTGSEGGCQDLKNYLKYSFTPARFWQVRIEIGKGNSKVIPVLN